MKHFCHVNLTKEHIMPRGVLVSNDQNQNANIKFSRHIRVQLQIHIHLDWSLKVYTKRGHVEVGPILSHVKAFCNCLVLDKELWVV